MALYQIFNPYASVILTTKFPCTFCGGVRARLVECGRVIVLVKQSIEIIKYATATASPSILFRIIHCPHSEEIIVGESHAHRCIAGTCKSAYIAECITCTSRQALCRNEYPFSTAVSSSYTTRVVSIKRTPTSEQRIADGASSILPEKQSYAWR